MSFSTDCITLLPILFFLLFGAPKKGKENDEEEGKTRRTADARSRKV